MSKCVTLPLSTFIHLQSPASTFPNEHATSKSTFCPLSPLLRRRFLRLRHRAALCSRVPPSAVAGIPIGIILAASATVCLYVFRGRMRRACRSCCGCCWCYPAADKEGSQLKQKLQAVGDVKKDPFVHFLESMTIVIYTTHLKSWR